MSEYLPELGSGVAGGLEHYLSELLAGLAAAGYAEKTRHDKRRYIVSFIRCPTCQRGRDPVFPSRRGGSLSADALQRLVARHAATASATCSSLAGRSITPHTLRHTTAMTLLRSGVDQTVIALWLGHESPETTQIYLHADLRMKEKALGYADPSGTAPPRFQPNDRLLAFLSSL